MKNLIDQLKGKLPFGFARSKDWPKVRKEHLKTNPVCVVCGGSKKLEVHHITPVHIDPSMELWLTNLITLCEAKKNGLNCHLAVGHIGSYKCHNPDVRNWVAFVSDKIKQRK